VKGKKVLSGCPEKSVNLLFPNANLTRKDASYEKSAKSKHWWNPAVWLASASLSDVTRILQSIDSGDPKAAEELPPLVYDELRRLAAARMAKESPGQTLQPTEMVHEAWLRLTGEEI